MSKMLTLSKTETSVGAKNQYGMPLAENAAAARAICRRKALLLGINTPLKKKDVMKDGFITVAAASPAVRVADCAANTKEIISCIISAAGQGVKVLVLPELSITGYTCGDLFGQRLLADTAQNCLLEIAAATKELELVAVVGTPLRHSSKLYNCAAFLSCGKILGVVPKTSLPNYAEFYERRQFTPAPNGITTMELGDQQVPFGTDLLFRCKELPELCLAAEICEDLWIPQPPSGRHALAGATILCNPSASDELVGKAEYRRQLVTGQSARLLCGYVYADAGIGESTTDLVFAGHNLVCENGVLLDEAKPFSGEMAMSQIDVLRLATERQRITSWKPLDDGYTVVEFSLPLTQTTITRPVYRRPFVPDDPATRSRRCEDILTMQAMGLRKRLEHIGKAPAVVGVSGGLDSCLALLVAVRAMDLLGQPHEHITAVTMPCFGTTKRTRGNAEELCTQLGVTLRTVDIKEAVDKHFADIGHDPSIHDVTYENSQARERTQVLMDIANQIGGIVIGTGDLSELALGWATYNGDHMSMYGVNASIPKTLVRYLVQHVADSSSQELRKVLTDILDTPVSPELLPAHDNGQIAQVTEDLVGPYELHDFYLYNILRMGYSPKKVYRLACLAFEGTFEPQTILQWLRVFYRRFFAQQFKRSCLPDGPKVGSVTLSPRGDWRMPSDACATLWLSELESLS